MKKILAIFAFIELYFYSKCSSLYRILGLGGGPGSNGPLLGGTVFIGESKNFAFFQARKFSRKFCDFLKILSKFSRKFREKFRKFWKYWFVGGSGGGAPEASENIKKLVEKSMENGKILKLFMKF